MITKYTPKDYPILCKWYAARKLATPSSDGLSTLGFIADNRVAGFLYLTNSNIALIDGLISNPDTSAELRKESLVRLAGTLVDTAMTLGYTNIIAVTKSSSVKRICERLGFRNDGYSTYILSDKDMYEDTL